MVDGGSVPVAAPASTHRLATVSASQALQSLRARGPRSISTGLATLDDILRPTGAAFQDILTARGGLARGHVAEVYGPPGSGKTAFGLQACTNVLKAGSHAIWIDTAAPLAYNRLSDMINGDSAPSVPTTETVSENLDTSGNGWEQRFHRFDAPTLAHLLALLVHPPDWLPLGKSSIIVVESLSTLFDNAYPRYRDEKATAKKTESAKWASSRRYGVLGDMANKLGKLAVLHDLVILLTCQTVTRMRPGVGPLLVPAISGLEWDHSLWTKLVLFRDWPPHQFQSNISSDPEKLSKLRFVGIEKTGGTALSDERAVNIVPFTIEPAGLSELKLQTTTSVAIQHLTSPVRPAKRPYTEIADSDDEDALNSDDLYDWAEAEEVTSEGLVNESVLIEEIPSVDGLE